MSLKKLDDQYVLHTYARREIAFERGRNATLFDENGRDYVDFTSGIGVNSIGCGNRVLAQAIAKQAEAMLHSSNLYVIRPQAELAQKIASLSGLDARVFFSNSGAEANEGASKLARKYGEKTGRHKSITLKNSFHGRTIAPLKATAHAKFHAHFGPFPDGFIYAENLSQAAKLIDRETIAVMLEAVQGEGGVEPLERAEFLELAEILKREDVLLIADEIQCGVYRCGEFTASQTYGVAPDIFTLAKGLGGGVPIGAVVTRLKDTFEYGDHGSTFGGNFLATRAALTTLEILGDRYECGELKRTIDYFDDFCRAIALNFPQLFTGVKGLGLMKAIVAKDGAKQKAIIDAAHANGVLVLRAGENHVRLLPPLTIGFDEIEEGFKRLNRACKAIV
jgi:acetylornithine aminotransferase